jgi:hypothetical protein
MTTPGREEVRPLSITVSSGSGTGTLTSIWAIARRVRIIPPSETTSYDVAIKDADGNLIINREAVVGTLSEIQELSLAIASTVTISNGSSDGTYKVRFDMH